LPLNHTPHNISQVDLITVILKYWLYWSNLCLNFLLYSCGDAWTRAWSNRTISWFQQSCASSCNRLWGENNV